MTQQVYQKHNRNLIGEDAGPEELIELALRRRLSSPRIAPPTGRFASVVASIINSPLSSSGSTLSNRANSELGSPTRQSSFESPQQATGLIISLISKINNDPLHNVLSKSLPSSVDIVQT